MLFKRDNFLKICRRHNRSCFKLIALAVFLVLIFLFSLFYKNSYKLLTVVDVYSHPKAGEQWKVGFQTIGKGDLRIIPADKITVNDLSFVTLSCDGKEKKSQILENNIYFPGWECLGTSKITYLVNNAGKHTLKFKFGDKTDYAYNTSWLTDWGYRKSHTINNASGTGTGYQEKIIVHFGSGTDSGENVYLNSNSKTDFSDIRFTDDDGSTLLDHWLEQKTDSDNAVFWVEIADDLSTSPATIYVYYGNASAVSASSGEATFLFFDDFSGTLSKWTVDAENTDAVSISSGALRHNADSSQTKGSYFDTRVITTDFQMTDGVIEYKAYLAGSSASSPRIIHQFGWRVQSLNFENGYCWRMQNSTNDGGHLRFTGKTSWSIFGTAFNAVTGNDWHTVREVVSGANYTGYVDQGTGYSGSNSTKLTAGYLVSHVHGVSLTSSSYVLIDDVRVRKYVATEPVHGAWGSEETPPVISVSVSDGSVDYGSMSVNDVKNTTAGGLNDTQILTNNGNVAEDFNIKGQNTTCPWTLAANNGVDQYKQEFSSDGGSNWSALTVSYQSFATNIATSGTQNLDIQLTTPTSTNCLTQESVDVSIQAIQH